MLTVVASVVGVMTIGGVAVGLGNDGKPYKEKKALLAVSEKKKKLEKRSLNAHLYKSYYSKSSQRNPFVERVSTDAPIGRHQSIGADNYPACEHDEASHCI